MVNDQSTQQIREACFDLSVSLMWSKEKFTIENIERNIQELNLMTEAFLKISLIHLENTESVSEHPEIIIKAIKYIDNVHAIPPLKGNIKWFEYTLVAVTEMAMPNSRLKKSNLDFLIDIEKGINDYRNNALDDEELTFGTA